MSCSQSMKQPWHWYASICKVCSCAGAIPEWYVLQFGECPCIINILESIWSDWTCSVSNYVERMFGQSPTFIIELMGRADSGVEAALQAPLANIMRLELFCVSELDAHNHASRETLCCSSFLLVLANFVLTRSMLLVWIRPSKNNDFSMWSCMCFVFPVFHECMPSSQKFTRCASNL